MEIDEEVFQAAMVDYIKELKYIQDIESESQREAKVQRVTQLCNDVIKVMDAAFNEKENKHDWLRKNNIIDTLKEYDRIQPDDTELDLLWAIGVPANMKRVTLKTFPEGTKYVLNKFFQMSDLDKLKQQPEPIPAKPKYKNPFE